MTDDELASIAAPSCPRCLVPMVAEGDRSPRWACPECALVQL